MIVPFLDSIFLRLVGTVVVVVVALALGGLSDNGADASTRRSANDGALQATTKDRAEHCAPGTANQRTLPGTNAALIASMVVVIRTIVIVVVAVAPVSTAAHAAIVSTIVMMLCERRSHHKSDKERKSQNCISKLAHLRLDAKFTSAESFSSKKS
jgi:hypothetical protein